MRRGETTARGCAPSSSRVMIRSSEHVKPALPSGTATTQVAIAIWVNYEGPPARPATRRAQKCARPVQRPGLALACPLPYVALRTRLQFQALEIMSCACFKIVGFFVNRNSRRSPSVTRPVQLDLAPGA